MRCAASGCNGLQCSTVICVTAARLHEVRMPSTSRVTSRRRRSGGHSMLDETELEQDAEQTTHSAADSIFDWQVAWTRPKPLSAIAGAPRVLVVGIVPSLTWSVTRCLSCAGMRPVVMGWHRFSPLWLVPDCRY